MGDFAGDRAPSPRVRIVDRGGRRELHVPSGESGVLLLFIQAFALLQAYAAIAPWTPKLEFPPYRVALAGCALGLSYFVLRSLVNVTRVFAVGDRLVLTHGPLPPRRRVDLPLAGLRRITHVTLLGTFLIYADGERQFFASNEDGGADLTRALAQQLGVEAVIDETTARGPGG